MISSYFQSLMNPAAAAGMVPIQVGYAVRKSTKAVEWCSTALKIPLFLTCGLYNSQICFDFLLVTPLYCNAIHMQTKSNALCD